MTFEDEIAIRATPETLFALTQDYGRRLEWDPFLRSAKLVGGSMQPMIDALCRADLAEKRAEHFATLLRAERER